jgi:hypothetical protein
VIQTAMRHHESSRAQRYSSYHYGTQGLIRAATHYLRHTRLMTAGWVLVWLLFVVLVLLICVCLGWKQAVRSATRATVVP